jgi:GntR family transcriptional regulator
VELAAQRTPQYLRIYRTLKRRIDAGELAAGARLPAQRALSREFGVTLMTLRQAIQLLERDGLVKTQHGLGTFVGSKRASYELSHLRSFAQEMNAQGLALTTRVLSQGFTLPSPDVAARLEVDGDASVLMLERLRLVDDEPTVYQRSHLPQWLGVALRGIDLSLGSLYDSLSALGLELRRAHESIQPVVLNAHEARLLDTAEGAPAVLSRRTTFGDDGPILYDEAFMPGDRLVISAERLTDDVTVSYQLRGVGEGSISWDAPIRPSPTRIQQRGSS